MVCLFEHLSRYPADAWTGMLDELLPRLHVIDREATRVWFAFYPLEEASWTAVEPDVDASHAFLFSHRFWPQLKSAIVNMDRRESWKGHPDGQLADLVTSVADAASRTARVDPERLLGLAAIGLMLLRQVGVETFGAAPGRVCLESAVEVLTATQVLSRRANPVGRNGFRALRARLAGRSTPSVMLVLDENASIQLWCPSGARMAEPTAECLEGRCWSCWVGVVAGGDGLSPLTSIEQARGASACLRLACQAVPAGSCTLALPPWTPPDAIHRHRSL